MHMHDIVACGGGSAWYMHVGSSCWSQSSHVSHVDASVLKLSCACGSVASVMIGSCSSGVDRSGGSCE